METVNHGNILHLMCPQKLNAIQFIVLCNSWYVNAHIQVHCNPVCTDYVFSMLYLIFRSANDRMCKKEKKTLCRSVGDVRRGDPLADRQIQGQNVSDHLIL